MLSQFTSAMKFTASIAITAGLLLPSMIYAANPSGDPKQFWPQWRGPLGTGVAPAADPPSSWSEDKHVKWKVNLPGTGDASPIIWGDNIFVLSGIATGKKVAAKTAENAESSADTQTPPDEGRRRGRRMNADKPNELYQFSILCLDRKTGKPLWTKTAREEVPHEGHHQNNTYASGSALTDGKVVLGFFGSRGLHCYDPQGNPKWSKDFGPMKIKMGFGEGASPALHGDTVVVNWDHEGDDFIAALDKNTGKELWRTPRNEGTTWSTPLVLTHGGKSQVIVNASGKVRSYDLATGKEIWSCAGQTANAIPTPVANADTVFVTSGFRGHAVYAIALDRTGDLTDTDAIRWKYDKSTPYVPSPLLVDELLYLVANNDGKLSCFDAKKGTPHYEAERLEGIFSIYASPVAAKDRIYVLGREGTCLVIKKGPKLEILATNKLDDKTDASIAIAGNELFIRGRKSLYCISNEAIGKSAALNQ
jgi:outer membrane protein assembly factor BamB